MWLITPIGFFSIVEKPEDRSRGTLTIRARVRRDLKELQAMYLHDMGRIKESTDSDYRFRAVAPRAQVAAAMAKMVEELEYENVKAEVARRQGYSRVNLYHDVWTVLHRLQAIAPRMQN